MAAMARQTQARMDQRPRCIDLRRLHRLRRPRQGQGPVPCQASSTACHWSDGVQVGRRMDATCPPALQTAAAWLLYAGMVEASCVVVKAETVQLRNSTPPTSGSQGHPNLASQGKCTCAERFGTGHVAAVATPSGAGLRKSLLVCSGLATCAFFGRACRHVVSKTLSSNVLWMGDPSETPNRKSCDPFVVTAAA